jgi:hypothetical protein
VTYRKFLQLEILEQLRVVILAISNDVSDAVVEFTLPSGAILKSSDDPLSATRMRIAIRKEVCNISNPEETNKCICVTYRNVGPERCVVVQGQV